MSYVNAHAKQWEIIHQELATDSDKGLSKKEVEKRLRQYGPNSLIETKKTSPILIFLSQFKSPFIIVLGIAALMSIYFGQLLDASAIGVVLLINASIGFAMEYQAQQSMEALKLLTVIPAKVLREGQVEEVPSHEVVPGDILYVEAGDMVQADARLFTLSQLEVNESALTGESMPISKKLDVLPVDCPMADRRNMLFKGTFITRGNGYAIVTNTGMQTEFGQIAEMVQSSEEEDTPLEKKINVFSRKLIWITSVLVVIIFLAGLLQGHPFVSMFKTSIALAVAAVPEALPIVATLALAQGMLRMARHNVIVKRLAAVETLGGTTVICTDKTGTLTENRIEVSMLSMDAGDLTIEPDAIHQSIHIQDGEQLLRTLNYEMIQLVSCLCNTADISVHGHELREVGDPLETGLLKFSRAGKKDILAIRKLHPKVKEEPFSSETKIMATCHASGGDYLTCVKGAVEELLLRCTHVLKDRETLPMDEATRAHYRNEAHRMAASGLRVIGAAFKEGHQIPDVLSRELTFAGLIGMMDPPRTEVAAAIHECRTAGIEVLMATGDHPATARNIGLKLGLLSGEGEIVMSGSEMGDYENLTEEKKKAWLSARIFARVTPKQKLDLVKFLQENEHVVGMTGDGVNDAPALKKADIGIAMGKRGTQVAQEVADMVLKDDSFTSIVVAIKQGRVIFENIRMFVVFLLSSNLSELAVIGATAVLDTHFALIPLQILFINLVTDALPALALGVSEANELVMQQKPRRTSEPIVGPKQWTALMVYALVLAGAAFAAVVWVHYTTHVNTTHPTEVCNNILFLTLIVSKLLHVFNVTPASSKSFFYSEVARNKFVWYALVICLSLTVLAFFIPGVAEALKLEPIALEDWGVVIFISVISVFFNRVLKQLRIVV
ncbi:MAG: cation-translocating P-type ATPase [Bacteroidetes bacterium]|nr:cation-translocating P-type ATPase [Bacteroidota bacterium]